MEYSFKNLVFEGGGVKGIAYGGALEILSQMNLLGNIKRVAGTSAGAINATLMALGYTSKDVSDIIANTNFKDFEDDSFLIFGDIRRLTNNYGWFKGDKFRTWIGKYIKDKTGKEDLTFKELAEQAEAKQFKLLYTVASNLSQQKAEIFSHEHTPDVIIRDAVRMSMSIPLYFQAFIRNNDVMVDGGVSWNYPINIFDYKKYIANPANSTSVAYTDNPDYLFNYETLGFRLDSKSVIEYAKHNWSNEPMEIDGIKDYVKALLNFLMEMANKSHLHQNDWNRTIFIDTLDVKTTDFKLSGLKIQQLIKSGKDCTMDYFKWRNEDPYWGKLPA
jgi:NTE family protein